MDSRSLILIFLLIFLSTFIIVIVAFIQEGVGGDVLSYIDNASKTVLDNQTQENNISDRIIEYNNSKIEYDTIFLVIFVTIELVAITLAFSSPKLPNLSFITFLFFGSAIFLFVYSIIIDINQYIFNNLLVGIFTDTVFTMPLYNYALGHQYILLGFNIIMLLLINRLFGRDEINSLQAVGGAVE